MNILGIPVWLFIAMMALSLFLGIALRVWLNRREARRALEKKERDKELKKQFKRAKKLAKKSAKRQKGKGGPKESDVESGA